MVHRRRNSPARQLLTTLTSSPALPTFIRRLPAPTLQRLIDHVGLPDSGELIALTSSEQLRELFEVTLWQNLAPGQAETLRTDRFLQWLDVLLEVSPAFAAERIIELGETFLVLQLGPLARVTEFSTAVTHRAGLPCRCPYCVLIEEGESADLFADYLVCAVHGDEWETVHTLLVELDRIDAEFLARVLARCCLGVTPLGFEDDGRALLADETHAREVRRERAGFATPEVAAAFLEAARRASIETICAQEGYDDISARYFEQCRRQATDVPVGVVPDAPSEAAELSELDAALAAAEITAAPAPRLLAAPRQRRSRRLELRAHLDAMQANDPAAFSARLAELVYLANVLMAGATRRGERFDERAAARAVLACANLGMDVLLDPARNSRAAAAAELLAEAPGVVRLFQVGWHVLQRLPARVAAVLEDTLQDPAMRQRLATRRWLADELVLALQDPPLLELIARRAFDVIADNLLLLSLLFDASACQSLHALLCDVPQYSREIDRRADATEHTVSSAVRAIATRRDLDRIDAFLAALPQRLRR
jgi:Family of unknown function (DUF6178)